MNKKIKRIILLVLSLGALALVIKYFHHYYISEFPLCYSNLVEEKQLVILGESYKCSERDTSYPYFQSTMEGVDLDGLEFVQTNFSTLNLQEISSLSLFLNTATDDTLREENIVGAVLWTKSFLRSQIHVFKRDQYGFDEIKELTCYPEKLSIEDYKNIASIFKENVGCVLSMADKDYGVTIKNFNRDDFNEVFNNKYVTNQTPH